MAGAGTNRAKGEATKRRQRQAARRSTGHNNATRAKPKAQARKKGKATQRVQRKATKR